MLGRELHLPLDRLRPIAVKNRLRPTAVQNRLRPTTVQNTLTPVKVSVARRQQRMKKWFDKKKRLRIPDITVADWVRVRRPHRENKMA